MYERGIQACGNGRQHDENEADDGEVNQHAVRLRAANHQPAQRVHKIGQRITQSDDAQPSQIIGAWFYALDTMIQEAQSSQTCSWTVEGADDDVIDDSDGGDITLRRV